MVLDKKGFVFLDLALTPWKCATKVEEYEYEE